VNSPLPPDAPRDPQPAHEPMAADLADSVMDRLISIREVALWFGLGRTAAYELTHRDDFPVPVVISPRCYRWPAREVAVFAAGLRRQQPAGRRTSGARLRARSEARAIGTGRRITGSVRAARGQGSAGP
jgi:predicted DNA-binding transcriptional regulator AlpA